MSDDDELLINTRQKRANAGNRLKLLLELEERQQEELAQTFTTEDDENVNLLFQEDEDDVEYSEEDSSENGEGGDDANQEEEREEEENLEEEDDEDKERATSKTSKKRKLTEDDSDLENGQFNEDDVFTDSDDDSEESDAEEGEKELQMRERAKKRAKLKKSKQHEIPIIKKVTTTQTHRRKSNMIDASSLLDNNRRSSSRRAVVENKLATVEKLKQLEERRKLNRPKEKVKKYEMTQEERLAEAVETEKQNILSLNRFKEQELSKKERQRMLQLSRRKNLINVVRYFSFPHYVTPVEELEEEKKIQELVESRKEKRGRKKRGGEEDSSTNKTEKKPALNISTQCQSSSPNIEENSNIIPTEQGQSNEPEPKKEVRDEDGDVAIKDDVVEIVNTELQAKDDASKQDIVQGEEAKDSSIDNVIEASVQSTLEHSPEAIIETDKSSVNEQETPSSPNIKKETIESASDVLEDADNLLLSNDEKHEVEQGDESAPQTKEEKDEPMDDSTEKLNITTDSSSPENSIVELKVETVAIEADLPIANKSQHMNETSKAKKTTEMPETIEALETTEMIKSTEPEVKTEEIDSKKVTFADEEEVIVLSTETDENEISEIKEEVEKFDQNPLDLDLSKANETEEKLSIEKTEEEEVPEVIYEGPEQLVSRNLITFEDFENEPDVATIKEILLGSQSLLPAQRRSNEVEPIVRIRAKSEDEDLERNLFKSVKDLKKQQFKDFFNLPKFGNDLSNLNVDDEEEDQEVVKEIKITTPAPIGIYLPNGVKKKCLITGKESQYFDPKSGLPYSSVEAYRILQLVQNGEFSWCQFNSTGGVYLNERDLKPANGCPDRF